MKKESHSKIIGGGNNKLMKQTPKVNSSTMVRHSSKDLCFVNGLDAQEKQFIALNRRQMLVKHMIGKSSILEMFKANIPFTKLLVKDQEVMSLERCKNWIRCI